MSTAQQGVGPATVSRMIHGALVTGCVLFVLVTHFLVLPNRADRLPPNVIYALLGGAALAVVLSFAVLRPRVPLKSTDESADLYWSRASVPALIAWSAAEAGALLSIVAYLLSGSGIALGASAFAIAALVALHPRALERA
jgi:hypothetical protein